MSFQGITSGVPVIARNVPGNRGLTNNDDNAPMFDDENVNRSLDDIRFYIFSLEFKVRLSEIWKASLPNGIIERDKKYAMTNHSAENEAHCYLNIIREDD